MTYRCNIEDIIEYSDGILSSESENTIKEHIKKCKNCRKAFYLYSFAGGFIKSTTVANTSIDSKIIESIDKNRYISKSFMFVIKELLCKSRPVLKLSAIVLVICIFLTAIILYKSSKDDYIKNQITISSPVPPISTDNQTPIKTITSVESISLQDLRKNPHFPQDEYEFKEVLGTVNISMDTAVQKAKSIAGEKSSTEAKKITAILVQFTNKKYPNIPGSDVILKDYPIWIVTFYDVYLITSGPKIADDSISQNATREVLANTNVFIDANSGEDLQIISYSAFSQLDAIYKALENHPDSGFPDSPGKVSGILHTGGKASGLRIPAEFETKADIDAEGVYIVTLTQYWNSKDLRGPNSQGPVLNYFWKYRVTEESIVKIDEGGDSTPLIMK